MRIINLSFKFVSSIIFLFCFSLTASEFTISSYNCGALSEHYDYLRACSMQKVMQERYNAESANMMLNDSIQRLALKILFTTEPTEKQAALREWNQKNYQQRYESIIASPMDSGSANTAWFHKVNASITTYKVRPVVIQDEELNHMIKDHLIDLVKIPDADMSQLLLDGRAIMAKRIFEHHLKYDIICLQEADYLNSSMFPSHYEVIFSESNHSVNGIAFDRNRFELEENMGDLDGRAHIVRLKDKETGKTVLVASGHIKGCNPYIVVKGATGESTDSTEGDGELQSIVDLFEEQEADLKLIGMDSNVTSLHPRLNIVKDAGYRLDYENFLEPTCTNPYLVLNTRIDWIVVKANESEKVSITNIPVLNVGLNSIQTNISDHKPIAAKISY